MRKKMKSFGLSLVAGVMTFSLTNMASPQSNKGEVKLIFSSSTHGYFGPCG